MFGNCGSSTGPPGPAQVASQSVGVVATLTDQIVCTQREPSPAHHTAAVSLVQLNHSPSRLSSPAKAAGRPRSSQYGAALPPAYQRPRSVAGLDLDDVALSAQKDSLRIRGKGRDGGRLRELPLTRPELRSTLATWLGCCAQEPTRRRTRSAVTLEQGGYVSASASAWRWRSPRPAARRDETIPVRSISAVTLAGP